MTWSCPYLLADGNCSLRASDCEPMARGCVINASTFRAKTKLAGKENKSVSRRTKEESKNDRKTSGDANSRDAGGTGECE